MPRPSSDGIYRTTPHVPSATGNGADSSAPSQAGKRAQASEGDGILSEPQIDVIGKVIAETANDLEKQARAALKALREEQQIEIGLVREELMSRMDARLFGSTLVDDASEVARKAVAEMRRETDAKLDAVSTGLDDLRVRLDRTERERKSSELDVWRGLTSQVARNFGRLKELETKLGTLASLVDTIGVELRQLRHDLGDASAKPWPAPLALPAPA